MFLCLSVFSCTCLHGWLSRCHFSSMYFIINTSQKSSSVCIFSNSVSFSSSLSLRLVPSYIWFRLDVGCRCKVCTLLFSVFDPKVHIDRFVCSGHLVLRSTAFWLFSIRVTFQIVIWFGFDEKPFFSILQDRQFFSLLSLCCFQ